MRKKIYIIFIAVLAIVGIFIIFKSLNFNFPIEFDTSWINSKLPIWYFSADNYLCRINLDGTGKICSKINKSSEFRFSPDGKKIAIVSSDRKLIILDTGDLSQKELLSTDSKIAQYAWSPNGDMIACSILNQDTNQDGKIDFMDDAPIYLIKVASEGKELLSKGFASQFDQIFWSKDGKNLFYQYTKRYNENDLREQFIKIDVFSKAEELIMEKDWMQSPSITKVIPNELLYFDQSNHPGSLITTKDSSDDKKTNVNAGSFYFNGKELLHFSWYDSKFNRGFFNPFFIDNKYIIFTGPTSNFFFSGNNYLYVADSDTGKIGRLVRGNSPGWYLK
jgi:WD40 repeat protein